MSRTGYGVWLRHYPAGALTADAFEVVEVPLTEPGPGQVLVRNSWTSVDPGLRLRLRPDAPAGYFAAFPLGQAMDGIMAVGEVVESRPDGFSSHGVAERGVGPGDGGGGCSATPGRGPRLRGGPLQAARRRPSVDRSHHQCRRRPRARPDAMGPPLTYHAALSTRKLLLRR